MPVGSVSGIRRDEEDEVVEDARAADLLDRLGRLAQTVVDGSSVLKRGPTVPPKSTALKVWPARSVWAVITPTL